MDVPPPATKTVRVEIHGRVQGVGFRASLRQQAHRLGVHGWVRNRREGHVEALLCGDARRVDELVEWARRGPPAARVTALQVHAAQGRFDTFEERPTA